LGSITTDVEGCKADVEKCDGIYGKLTKEMVKQYQKDNGLAVDGIVGQQTYDAMF
jgi:peptidoglycan hydrolase-like protein with peptidoglycan-binding domain